MFALATTILDQAEGIVTEAEWTPVWAAEYATSRLSLLQDNGEQEQAFSWIQRACGAWLYIGDVLFGESSDDARPIFRGAEEMYLALVGPERLEHVWERVDAAVEHVILWTWLSGRWAPAIDEVVGRTGSLMALSSYEQARRFLGGFLGQVRRWAVPELLDIEMLEAALQLQLSAHSELHEEAVARAESGLRLVAKARPGPKQRRREAELRTNRANGLVRLGRLEAAREEFAKAQVVFEELGAVTAALRCRQGALAARFMAGGQVDAPALRAFISEFEGAVNQLTRSDGGAMADLEQARRLYLSLLARPGSGATLEEVVSVLEAVRDDIPIFREAANWDDLTMDRLFRPFGVAGSRLSTLRDSILVVHEPGMDGPLFVILESGAAGQVIEWHILSGGEGTSQALSELAMAAEDERARLIAGEVPLRSPPSGRLLDAGDRAWLSLPIELRQAIGRARVVFYMPSALAGIDASPIELLRWDGTWIGTTHVVVRCPSFQYFDRLLAPNRVSSARDPSAAVVQATPSEAFGPLEEAEADTATALRAAQVLGLEAERREVSSRDDMVAILRTAGLLHYVGHGYASAIGEVLPLSPSVALRPSALSGTDEGSFPFVYFSACQLARTRHVSGGRQMGWALALLEYGAPAVVGALFAVPDEACPVMTEAFYRGAWRSSVGEGMRGARAQLDREGVNPAIWGAFVLLGDPNFVLSTGVPPTARSTSDLTRRWPALVTRHLATKLPDFLEEAQRDVEADPLLARSPAALASLRWWLHRPDPERLELSEEGLLRAIEELLAFDLEGAAILRILLALGRAESSRPEDWAGPVRDEFGTAWVAADLLEDNYAIPLIAHSFLRHWDSGRPPRERDLVIQGAAHCLRLLPRDSESLAWLTESLLIHQGA